MKKSALLGSMVCIFVFLFALLGLLCFAPWLCRWYVGLRGMPANVYTALLITFYACAAPALVALLSLLALVRNIGRAAPFSRRNSALLALVSYCCLLVAAISCVGALRYLPLLLVTVAMVFLFLIVRVVRGCFAAALRLQEENSLTI